MLIQDTESVLHRNVNIETITEEKRKKIKGFTLAKLHKVKDEKKAKEDKKPKK